MLGLYKSCKTCPAKNFFEVIESGDVRYIMKITDFDELPEEMPEDIEDVWNGLVDEYSILSNNLAYRSTLNKQSTLLKNMNRINTVMAALNVLRHGSIEAEEALKHFGYKLDDIKDLKSFTSKMNAEMSGLKIRKAKLDAAKGGKTDFYKTVAAVEKELNRSLDIDKLTLKHWCAILNDLNDGRKDKKR